MQDVNDLVRGTKIRDLVYQAQIDACKQMQDVWPVLQEEERDRMVNLAQSNAERVEREIADRVGQILDAFIASGQPSVAAVEKGIAIEGSGVTIKLAAVRSKVPREFFTHKGEFLIVLTHGGVLSLEELNRQGDFFENDDTGLSPAAGLADELRGDSPIVAQFKASTKAHAAEPEDPSQLWIDEFLIALGQLTSPEYAAHYDANGTNAALLGVYIEHGGWTPTEAATNESLADVDRRPIADGPPPINTDDGEAAA